MIADPETPTDVATAAPGLGRLRLLLALDALLVEGGVTRAAARLGVGAPAMSRMLGQLREMFRDPLLVRRGRGMTPTPLAEGLRLRVRALASEADAILSGRDAAPPLVDAPPLGFDAPNPFAGAPSPALIASRLAAIDADAGPRRRLGRFIATLAGGPGRARPLDAAEAEEAFAAILRGEAEPVQTGALLAAVQQRGATAAELAGFARAAREAVGARAMGAGPADLDWPAHLSPRVRAAPWFAHAARLVGLAGFGVAVHGGPAEAFAGWAACCDDAAAAERALARPGVAHLPLAAVSPALRDLVRLYGSLGMRSPVNPMLALLNPLGAPAVALGGGDASYRAAQVDALRLLGAPRAVALLGWRDVMQAAAAPADMLALEDGVVAERAAPRASQAMEAARPASMSVQDYWRAVWSGAARDAAAESVVLTTAAVALRLAERPRLSEADADGWAAALWRERRGGPAARAIPVRVRGARSARREPVTDGPLRAPGARL